MAAKDFVTRFLTDLSRWRVADAADDLDDVASSADRTERSLADVEGAGREAGRGLEAVASAARDAEGDLEQVGAEAKAAGRDVDAGADDAESAADRIADAFRKVKASADDDLGKVGDGARKGTQEVSEATKEMGGEVREELVSMAGSFDGTFSSAADSAQALTSAIAQSLGPLGVGIGAGLALGIGLFRASVERSKEAVAGLVERMTSLADGTSSAEEATRDYVSGLEDQGAALRRMKQDAETLDVPLSTLAQAYAGNADALQLVTERTDRWREASSLLEAQAAAGIQNTDASAESFGSLSRETRNLTENTEAAVETQALVREALEGTAAAAEAAAERQQGFGSALGEFIDPASIYTDTLQELAQETADKTKDQKDSWETYANSTDVALSKVNEGLRKQVEAQEEWATNMATVAERASTETLDYLRELGPSGAGLVKKLAEASDPEMAEFESLMKRRSAAGVANVARSIEEGTTAAVLAARRSRDAIAAVYAEPIRQLVEAKADPRSLSLMRQEMAQAINGAAQGAARSRS